MVSEICCPHFSVSRFSIIRLRRVFDDEASLQFADLLGEAGGFDAVAAALLEFLVENDAPIVYTCLMTLTLHLPAKLSEFITSQVATGFYNDAEEVVMDAVRCQARQESSMHLVDDDPELVEALLAGVRSPKHELNEALWTSMRVRAFQLASAS